VLATSALAVAMTLWAAVRIVFLFEEILFRPVRWLAGGQGARRPPSLADVARAQLARIRFLQTRTTGWSGKLTMPMSSEVNLARSTALAEQPLTYPEIVGSLREFIR
jgi:hypothetical protein